MKSSRIPYIHLLPIIALSIGLYIIMTNGTVISSVIKIITPIIWGFGIAYLLNPLVTILEFDGKVRRAISILVVYVLLIGSFVTLAFVIIPAIAASVSDLLENLPAFLKNFQIEITKIVTSLVESPVGRYIDVERVNQAISQVTSIIDNVVTAIIRSAAGITSGVMKFIMGLIISIYLLKDKDVFKRSINKFLYARFTRDHAERIQAFGVEADQIFTRYLVGKSIDSLIIGILAYFGFELLNAPYPLLLGVIIGITNMIPYFGPFIGAVPAGLITLFFSPIKAVWVLLFILILQQVDGYIIGPKILGDSVGLSPFWIILAILLGGGFFGFPGMLLGVPTMAIIRNSFNRYVNRRLDEKNMKI